MSAEIPGTSLPTRPYLHVNVSTPTGAARFDNAMAPTTASGAAIHVLLVQQPKPKLAPPVKFIPEQVEIQ